MLKFRNIDKEWGFEAPGKIIFTENIAFLDVPDKVAQLKLRNENFIGKEGTHMKRIMTLILAAGMVFGAATGASAIDFKAKGQWIFGFGAVDTGYVSKQGGNNQYNADTFNAIQRVRLQMEAVASESLSGTVYFEMGDQTWGNGRSGAALGADGVIVEVKRAYIDWVVPNTDLKFRMGIQGVTLPNVAGGSSILDDDVAGIAASYKFNDMVSLTALWARPYNDNYTAGSIAWSRDPSGYLDNVDLFALMLPVKAEGWEVTPWAMMGMQGKNTTVAGTAAESVTAGMNSINVAQGAFQGDPGFWARYSASNIRSKDAYRTLFWAGLPIAYTGLDPWNFELDLNYGYAGNNVTYSVTDYKNGVTKRADNNRQGWLIKGLVEYKMDWGTPGLFAWYASGDDGDVKNGSERMPSLSPAGNFTSFMGDGVTGWSVRSSNWRNAGYDQMLTYSGTWGIGGQLKDMSFLENLSHTFRVAYWGGTNSPTMAKYLPAIGATNIGTYERAAEGFYLTTNDSMVEFNLDSTYKIYENLSATLELGYIINGIDKGTWQRSYTPDNERFTKKDAYKAALIFNYSF